VGGAVGGTVVIAIAVVGVFFLRRKPPNRSSPAFVIDIPSQPHRESQKALSDDGNHTRSSTIGTPIVPMRLYVRILRPHILRCVLACSFILPVQDPNDTTTFPGYRESLHAPYGSAQPPFSQHSGTGNTMANMHVSRPHEYNNMATT